MVPHVQQQQRLAIQYMTNDYGSRQMFLWLRMTPHYSISDVCRVLEAIDLTRNLREMKMDEFRTILNHINKVKVQVASDGTVERWLKKEEVKEEVSPIVPGPEKQEK
jgi:hypothetical protein